MVGWRVNKGTSSNINIKLTLEFTNSVTYDRICHTAGDTQILYLNNYRIIFDQTALQATKKKYLDVQSFVADSGVIAPYSLIFSDPINYVAGVNYFNFTSSQVPAMNYNSVAFTLSSPGYTSINISTMNYR